MLADTSVLRAFAAAGRLPLLRTREPLRCTARVVDEMHRSGVPAAVASMGRALDAGWLVPVKERPERETLRTVQALGGHRLSSTDLELVALAHDLLEPLLTDDADMLDVAKAIGVEGHDIPLILEALKVAGVLGTRQAMLDVVVRLETFDGRTFRAPDRSRLLRY